MSEAASEKRTPMWS